MASERDELMMEKIHSALDLLTTNIDTESFCWEVEAEVKGIRENLSEQASS